MPVRVRYYIGGTRLLSVDKAYSWVRDVDMTIPDNQPTRQVIKSFLIFWNRTYGFLQQAEFLRHLKLYVDQVEVLKGIRDIADEVIRDYPPETYLYVGVGRSPSPLIGELKNRRCRTVTFPLSDFRPRNLTWSVTDDTLNSKSPPGREAARITAEQQSDLFSHFKRFFPRRPNRPAVLVIDFTITALSLIAAQEQLRNFFAKEYGSPDVRVHALAICRDSDARDVKAIGMNIGTPRSLLTHPIDNLFYTDNRETFQNQWHVLPLGPEQAGSATSRQRLVMNAFRQELFDSSAEFGPYKILQANAQVIQHTSNAGVMAACTAIREELKNVALM